MKYSSILLLLCFAIFGFKPNYGLIGKWTLERLETKTKTIFPNNPRHYHLTIMDSGFSYNLEVNDCVQGIISLNDTSISLYQYPACTKVCCDGRHDTIAKYINYSGTYTLHDSLLTITNDKGKFYLRRQ